ncbi:hypothetical protein FHS51_001715 [Sphingobium wenxiniae]|uniref:Uncharacterized protein n=1 Tax=Sphingobium wenxiniae (strain DSM 21828 / CGMCC 1.7748 / JZ-1) TaxID=595605 RepID=A0A562KCU2_SPHWJ|nr:hypothetical protein [Sphingobium wenxiniae]MBB6191488.1 hypothetical protein [Sphingobium wenxiniae]TWH93221.1 hypothetical protein IQ35_02128 [Sphingobium wenxiniae]
MTKVRASLSFAAAVYEIGSHIGWRAAAHLTRRGERAVRHWSDGDRKASPSLEQAFALDRAYVDAGGKYPPILTSYARRFDIELVPVAPCRSELTDDIAEAARESGEAVSASILLVHDRVTLAIVDRAIEETEQGMGSFTRLIRRLKSFRSAMVPVRSCG